MPNRDHHHCDVPFERLFDSLNETIALRVFRTTGDVFKISLLSPCYVLLDCNREP